MIYSKNFRAARANLLRVVKNFWKKSWQINDIFKHFRAAHANLLNISLKMPGSQRVTEKARQISPVSQHVTERSKDLSLVSTCHGKSSTYFVRKSACHGKRCNSFKNDISSQKLTLARLIKTYKHFYNMSIFVLQNISGEIFLVLELLGSKD